VTVMVKIHSCILSQVYKNFFQIFIQSGTIKKKSAL